MVEQHLNAILRLLVTTAVGTYHSVILVHIVALPVVVGSEGVGVGLHIEDKLHRLSVDSDADYARFDGVVVGAVIILRHAEAVQLQSGSLSVGRGIVASLFAARGEGALAFAGFEGIEEADVAIVADEGLAGLSDGCARAEFKGGLGDRVAVVVEEEPARVGAILRAHLYERLIGCGIAVGASEVEVALGHKIDAGVGNLVVVVVVDIHHGHVAGKEGTVGAIGGLVAQFEVVIVVGVLVLVVVTEGARLFVVAIPVEQVVSLGIGGGSAERTAGAQLHLEGGLRSVQKGLTSG